MDQGNVSTKDLLKELMSSLQMISIYDVQHPISQNALQQLYNNFSSVLDKIEEVSFGVAEDELFCGKEVFFDLRSQVKDFVQVLKEKDIHYIRFRRGLLQQELIDFLSLLSIRKKDKIQDAVAEIFQEDRFFHIQVGRFGQVLADAKDEKKQERKKDLLYFSSLYEDFLDKGTSIFEKGLQLREVDYDSILSMVSTMVDTVTSPRNLLYMILNVKKYDDYTFVHCMNVAVLTMFQARSLRLPRETTVKLAIAGFLHDIGKVVIKKTILDKKEKLTDEEFKKIKNHVIFGANILLKNPTIDKLPLVVNYQHHMGYNMNGYPRAHFLQKQNLASQIVSISDVYDALRTRRSYRGDIPLERVYEIMSKESGRLFDPYLLELFFKNIGIWPVGTLVRLDTQEVGVVSENNPQDILRPKVDVYYDPQGRKLKDVVTVDLTEKDENDGFKRRILRHLSASGEGIKFIREIFGQEA